MIKNFKQFLLENQTDTVHGHALGHARPEAEETRILNTIEDVVQDYGYDLDTDFDKVVNLTVQATGADISFVQNCIKKHIEKLAKSTGQTSPESVGELVVSNKQRDSLTEGLSYNATAKQLIQRFTIGENANTLLTLKHSDINMYPMAALIAKVAGYSFWNNQKWYFDKTNLMYNETVILGDALNGSQTFSELVDDLKNANVFECTNCMIIENEIGVNLKFLLTKETSNRDELYELEDMLKDLAESFYKKDSIIMKYETHYKGNEFNVWFYISNIPKKYKHNDVAEIIKDEFGDCQTKNYGTF